MAISFFGGPSIFAKVRFSSPMLLSRLKSSQSSSSVLGKDWVFERKYDGVRCIVVKSQNKVSLYSRNRFNYTPYFPELVEDFQKQEGSFVVDGEIVSSSFFSLQKRINCKHPEKKIDTKVSIKLFDIINDNGTNMMHWSYLERKKALKSRISFNKTIGYVQHRSGSKQVLLKESRQKKWEGIVAKRVDAPYENKRSRNALKFVNLINKKFYICGFKVRKHRKRMVGTLILGHSVNNLKYSGRVYVGLTRQMNKVLRERVSSFASTTPTVSLHTRKKERITWVQPRWQIRVAFLSYTPNGLLRSPRIVASRYDVPIVKA